MKSTQIGLRCSAVLIPFLALGVAQAQVPANIEASLRQIGQIVDPGCTAKLYRPFMPASDLNSGATSLYPGVTIARDVSFGPNPKDVMDIFTGEKGGGSRTVLLYVPGGQGNKTEQQVREANAFYDNIGRWGAKNGMVVVTMQRHPGANWDDPAKDVSAMIQWAEANIGKYKGNAARMFIWAQSAGNGPLGTYLGHPELYGPKGAGVKCAIFMSGQFNILPLNPPNPQGPGGNFAGTGSTCGGPGQGDVARDHQRTQRRGIRGPRGWWRSGSRARCGHPTLAIQPPRAREDQGGVTVRQRRTRSRHRRRDEPVLPDLA